MGVDTKGYLKKDVTASDVYNVIQTKFDKDAVFDVKEDNYMKNGAEIGNIHFKFNNEDRRLFYCITARDSEADKNILFDGEKHYVALILSCWGNSSHIMTEIVKEFGGYVDENDCDEHEAYYIEKDGEFSYSEYVTERNKFADILDPELSTSMKYQIAAQIMKHRDKLIEML